MGEDFWREEMKLTKGKKKDAYVRIELDKNEAELLLHAFGCRNNLGSCNIKEVKNDKFQQKFYALLQEANIPFWPNYPIFK